MGKGVDNRCKSSLRNRANGVNDIKFGTLTQILAIFSFNIKVNIKYSHMVDNSYKQLENVPQQQYTLYN